MKNKKHIDSLFKERFKDFEATPSPKVWKNIQSKLKKDEEDRKIIPIWWRWAGVAALLILLLTVGKFVFFPADTPTENNIVTEETIPETNQDVLVDDDEISAPDPDAVDSDQKGSDPLIGGELSEIAVEEGQTVPEGTGTETSATGDRKSNNESTLKNQQVETGIAVEEDKSVLKEELKDPQNYRNEPKTVETEAIAGKVTDKTNETIEGKAEVVEDISKEGVAVETETKDPTIADPQTTDPETIEKVNKDIKQEVGIATVVAIDKDKEVTDKKTKKEDAIAEAEVKEEDKPSILDAIDEQNEAIAANQEDKEANSWEVTPNFAPVYYSSLGEGSSIDPSFADNSQSGDVNLSYGVQVSYQLTERLSIRSGVNNVDLGYSTGDVELATGPVSTALRSVNYGGKDIVLSAFDSGTLAQNEMPAPGDPFSNVVPKNSGGNAEIIQNLSYFEVPMELKYALLNKRFGINMIGGFSALFLGDNEIVVQDGDFRSTLGEANNLNDLSFSTNVGLGFDYKFSKRFRFSLEPMFKYQLNPYSDSSVSFRPYYLGVYSGLSFRF